MTDPIQIESPQAQINRARYAGKDFLRFCEKLLVGGGGCWEWQGAAQGDGYAFFFVAGKNRLAHRVSWEIFYGPIPADMDVLHTCDNRLCVHPDHLFLGDQATNMADKVAKGRQSKGETHGRAKLTDDIVREMRRKYHAGEASQNQLAREHGVDQKAVFRAVHGLTWRHVS